MILRKGAVSARNGEKLLIPINMKEGSLICVGKGNEEWKDVYKRQVLLAAGIDKPVGLETKFIRWGCLLCIAFAAVVCYSYGGSPTQLIFIANIATAIATPFGGFFVCRLIFRKDVNAGLKTPRVDVYKRQGMSSA